MFWKRPQSPSIAHLEFSGITPLERQCRILFQCLVDAKKAKNEFDKANPYHTTNKYYRRVNDAEDALHRFEDDHPVIVLEMIRQIERQKQQQENDREAQRQAAEDARDRERKEGYEKEQAERRIRDERYSLEVKQRAEAAAQREAERYHRWLTETTVSESDNYGSFQIICAQLGTKVSVHIQLTEAQHTTADRAQLWDEPVLQFNANVTQKDIDWRKDHQDPAFIPETYARMLPVRNGYAVTLRMLSDQFEFQTLTDDEVSIVLRNFWAAGVYGLQLIQRIRYLCDNAPEPEEVIEPITPPEIPLSTRFQGQWVIGTQGSGKTQLLQHQISRDLDMVAARQASLIVIDPTGDQAGRLIHNIATLKRFAPGGDLHGRLVYIDPRDQGYTLPINLLSLRAETYDDDAISNAISNYLSIMGGLMGQPLTSFQEPVFRFAVQAALAFPNPTLTTLREIIAPNQKKYLEVIDKLHPDVASYFRDIYDTEGPRRSRGEILNRLYTLTSDPKFRRLFGASETKIDFSEEINQPKVILINASRDYLQSLTELYGRYFLALITQAAERRASMPLGSPIPCFIYIDECDEFVANDPNAAKLLLKLRGMRMALILGNQLVSRINDASVERVFLVPQLSS